MFYFLSNFFLFFFLIFHLLHGYVQVLGRHLEPLYYYLLHSSFTVTPHLCYYIIYRCCWWRSIYTFCRHLIGYDVIPYSQPPNGQLKKKKRTWKIAMNKYKGVHICAQFDLLTDILKRASFWSELWVIVQVLPRVRQDSIQTILKGRASSTGPIAHLSLDPHRASSSVPTATTRWVCPPR